MDCADGDKFDGERLDDGPGASHVIQFGRLAARRKDSGSAPRQWPTGQGGGCRPVATLVWQDLPKCPLNPVDFFANHSDRLLVDQGVAYRSDSFHCASYFVTPSPNKVEPCASLLAMSVDAANELSGEPGKYQTKEHLNGNTIGGAVKLRKQ